MVHKLLSALHKEYLLLIRDLPALLIILIMPVALVVIVTVAQNSAVKNSRETKTEVLFVDNGKSDFSAKLAENLTNSGLYTIVTNLDNKPINESEAIHQVVNGKSLVGIIAGAKDTVVTILVDPTMLDSYKTSLLVPLLYLIKSTQSRYAVEVIFSNLSPQMGIAMNQVVDDAVKNLPPVREVYPTRDKTTIKPSLSQNAIPGFILFAMFFIVIPLSGSVIAEKSEGAYHRLKVLPVSSLLILSSKVIIYLGVCLIQFFLMMLSGVWLLPVVFDLPQFIVGDHYLSILALTIACGLAANAFGIFFGAFSSSHAQAAILGSLIVVILSMISGSFLPNYFLPKGLQILSLASPIRWGIDGYIEIFIRDNNFGSILPHLFFLLLFFLIVMTASVLKFAKR
jgi:ABC-2 type transport system permease protein